MQSIINSVSVNHKIAAAEGWSVQAVTSCMLRLVEENESRVKAVAAELDRKLREYAGSDYEQVKNLHPFQLGDEPWEQACAEVLEQLDTCWSSDYLPCSGEVAYMLDVEPSDELFSCVEQLNSKFSF